MHIALRPFFYLAVFLTTTYTSAEERSSDQSGGFVLGVFYFEQLCQKSIGNPEQFHKLVRNSDLKPIAAEEYRKVASQNGLEGWERREENVRVMVEYTKFMGCHVYVSHGKEDDFRSHITFASQAEASKGKRVLLATDERSAPPGIPPYKLLRFNIYSPEGNYYLMSVTSEAPYRGNQAMFAAGPFR